MTAYGSSYKPASLTSDTFTPDRLVAGPMPLASKKVTLLSGQSRTRGAVLGKITASGKYTLSASAAADGSQTPDVVLAQDCDATAGDAEALVYERGDFNTSALTLGAGHTASSIAAGLRAKGITLVSAQSA
jgi:hypothetical protein